MKLTHRRSLCPGSIILVLFRVVAASLFLTACRHPSSPGDLSPEIAGTYRLVTVEGKSLPATIKHEGAVMEVRSGTFVINADATCSTTTTFVPPSGREVVREVRATYTKHESKLTMKWRGAGVTTATVEGNTLTMNNEGMVFVYER